jgi:hypothetical protein
MKNLAKFFAGTFAVAVLASCSGGNGPDKVASAYLNALKEKNYEKAKELGTKDTKDMLDALVKSQMAPEVTEVKDVKCTEDGNTATCTYCCSKDGKNSLKLIKEGDKWLVNEKKEMGLPTGPDTQEETSEEVPAAEVPAADKAPADKAPADKAPADKAPANKAPANKAPAKK